MLYPKSAVLIERGDPLCWWHELCTRRVCRLTYEVNDPLLYRAFVPRLEWNPGLSGSQTYGSENANGSLQQNSPIEFHFVYSFVFGKERRQNINSTRRTPNTSFFDARAMFAALMFFCAPGRPNAGSPGT